MLKQSTRGIILVVFAFLVACEDVVEIVLPLQESKLIIDALIPVDISKKETPVAIKVSLTDGFFGTVPLTKLENIIIIYEKIEGDLISETGPIAFADIANNFGVYETVIPTILFQEDIRFSLYVEHEGRVYLAQTFFSMATPINAVRQGNSELFNEDDIEIVVSFTDIPDKDNFYILDLGFEEFATINDSFFEGQAYSFSYFYEREIAVGTEIEVRLLGADQSFFNYMDLVIEQSEGTFELFETPVATARGNIIDVTNIDNIDIFDNVQRPELFALGYFAIVQEFKETITIE